MDLLVHLQSVMLVPEAFGNEEAKVELLVNGLESLPAQLNQAITHGHKIWMFHLQRQPTWFLLGQLIAPLVTGVEQRELLEVGEWYTPQESWK
jgi:hypothetical protein